jgi:AraC-like DNA-binding protein/mannose-6-phosphate isomerase-like protein (cupin superfamily)
MVKRKTHRPLTVKFNEAGICVLESHHSHRFRMGWTSHPFSKLLFVLAGRGSIVTREGSLPLVKHSIAFVPPGTAHHLQDDPGEPLALHLLCVDPPRGVSLDLPKSVAVFVLNEPGLSLRARSAMRRLLAEQSLALPYATLLSLGLATTLLAQVLRAASDRIPPSEKHDSLKQRVRDYISSLNDSFPEPDTLDAVAARLGMSRRRFTQIFREMTGLSWQAYLRDLRLAHAQRLLSSTDRTVLSIAFESGFDDLAHFHRVFKSQTGKTPLQWRATTRS